MGNLFELRATAKHHERKKRRRVCSECLPHDEHVIVLGPIYSERACDVCKTKPCRGAMVEG